MVNVRHRVCQFEKCGTEAKYNYPGEQQVILQSQHDIEGFLEFWACHLY